MTLPNTQFQKRNTVHTEAAWNWDTMPLSKSMVQTFEQCPHRWWRTWILKEKEEPQPQMERGKEFHAMVDELYGHLKQQESEFRVDLSEERFAQLYFQFLPREPMYEAFVRMDWRRFQATRRKELFFPKYKELFYHDMRIHYYGRVDRIDQMDNGEYVVVDYKTGKYRDYMLSKYRNEMAGYKHLIETMKLLDKPIRYLAIIFIEGEYVLFEEFKPQTINAFYEKLDRVRAKLREMKAQGKFKRNLTELCHWCPHMDPCYAEWAIEEAESVKG